MRYILAIAVILVTFIGISYAQCPISVSTKSAEAAGVEGIAPETQEAVEVGNTICPVSGDEIDPEAKVTYEYEGNIYNFCCPACIDGFKEDPEGYIKILEELKE